MLSQMGPLNKVMEMLPGMGSILKEGAGRDSSQKIKSYMTIMDSMTDEGMIVPHVARNMLHRWLTAVCACRAGRLEGVGQELAVAHRAHRSRIGTVGEGS
jgi:hypothetical protein